MRVSIKYPTHPNSLFPPSGNQGCYNRRVEARDKAGDLKGRVNALGRDPFLKIISWCSPIFIVMAFLPSHLEPDWVRYLVASLLVAFLIGLLRHRFYLSAFGLFVCMGGAGLSIWYDLSGTKRPPADHYTGLILLTGIAIFGLDILITWARYKSWEREAEATVPPASA